MADSVTLHYSWAYPTVGGDVSTWGATLNATINSIDAQVYAIQQSIPSGSYVTQGGGTGMAPGHTISAGWSGTALLAQVDTSPLGYVYHSSFNGGGSPGGAITISTAAPSGTPNDGDIWIQHA